MPFQHLRRFDLNLLLVFHQLMQTRHVSAAAVALGMSQPAVSAALARLRQATGDELFVRSGKNGMQPTPYAEQMAAPVAVALEQISQGLRPMQPFDPARSARTFTLTMLDAAEAHFLPGLVAYCDAVAPGVRLQIQPLPAAAGGVREALMQGAVDLAIGAFEDMPQGAMQQQLLEQPFVVIARQGHAALPVAPVVPASVGVAELPLLEPALLRDQPCVLVQPARGIYAQVQQQWLALIGARAARHICANLLTAPLVVAQTNLLALVPMHLALSFAPRLGLQVYQLRAPLPRLKTFCFWHPRYHRDPGNVWLRDCIFSQKYLPH